MTLSPVLARLSPGRWLPRTVAAVSIGAAVWCAAGLIASEVTGSGATRLAVPASVWWFIGPAGLFALAPGTGRRPFVALPAVAAIVPWLPLPLPAPLLIWTGRLAWVPVGLSAGLALWHSRAGTDRSTVGTAPGVGPWLAGLVTFAVAALAAWSLAPNLPGGDEPHYLMITQSLRFDHDLRIENNHALQQSATFTEQTLRPDFIQRGRDEVIYSIHAPGVSLLVLPLFTLWGYVGAQLTVMLLASLTAVIMWRAAWLASGDRLAAWFAWGAVSLSVTFLAQAVTVFPDGPGMLPGAVATLGLVALGRGRPPGPVSLLVMGTLLAGLPWLHTRFVVLALVLGIALAVRVATTPTLLPSRRLRLVGILFAVPVVSAAFWLAFFYVLYGVADPRVPYGALGSQQTRVAYVPGGLTALFLDQEFGLLAYAPVLAVAFVGWWRWGRQDDVDSCRPAGVAMLAYLMAAGTYWMWWAGEPAPPARFVTAALPALAPPIAVAWRRLTDVGRSVCVVLLAVSVATTAVVLGLDHGRLAWDAPSAHSTLLVWLRSAVNLTGAFPSFFRNLIPGDPASEWPFFRHAALFVGVTGLVVWAASRWSRARLSDGSAPIAGTCGWLLAVTAAATVGWTTSGESAWASTSAQFALVRAVADDTAVRIGATGWHRTPFSRDVRIAAWGPSSGWGALTGLPPGRYRVRLTSGRPVAGTFSVRLAGAPGVLRRWDVAPTSQQTFNLALPAGAAALVPEVDDALRSLLSVEVLPVAPGRPRPDTSPEVDGDDAAINHVGIDGIDLFVLSGGFVEPSGLWTHDREAVRLMIATGDVSAGDPIAGGVRLVLGNGPVDNAVTLVVDGVAQTVKLAAGERRRVAIPLDRDGAARVSVVAARSFRPAETSGDDWRRLGVWVSVSR